MNILDNILDKVEEALNNLYEKDQYLICSKGNNHVSERSITHKLGSYLTPLFEEYDVDCEYNRFGYECKFIKKLNRNVIPDIIIHKRGKGNNFIAIEVKTWWNKSKVSEDKRKLIELTKSKYNYKYGISLIINKNRNKVSKVIFYKGKELDR
ncbi:hypothetical protein [uncultured Veillonella sp.]|uniref:hypothetical protein n=1 Tax=uncultured Veillonella sp. TaxID=159268 RepID=UPI0028DBD267|nr:hypothetical protein [uncultured Veillonella sp.]